MLGGFRLRTIGLILILVGLLAGLGSTWIWFESVHAWRTHLSRAHMAGYSLYEALRTGSALPTGITAVPMSDADAALAQSGDFSRLPDLPTPAFVTIVSIRDQSADPLSGDVLTVGIVSDRLRYAVADMASDEGQPAALKFGNVTRLLATFCSEPILIAQLGDGPWQRIDGTAIWGCDSAPSDLRLAAVFGGVLSLAMLLTLVADTSSHFDRFARALRTRRRLGGPESYSADGPEELREIVAAVNSYLEDERDQLSKRAIVLSGVSHDLGTPATRLRLRAALIPDLDLRQKLETDIDKMTGMIESVLTYTRSELNVEQPRQVSLTSLVEALVADYQDVGRPVELRPVRPLKAEGTSSLFSANRGHGSAPDLQRILVTARPISLQRAVSNLIDNALKYGRRATLEVSANAEKALIVVEDEGSDVSVEDIEAVIAPFKRGQNTESISGLGLGLTIVATVAEQHGGQLWFEAGGHGLRACLEISRT